MIRSLNDDHGNTRGPHITPAAPASAARLTELLRETAGVWQGEEGARIERHIHDLRKAPERLRFDDPATNR